jgi:hypothetical protein
VARLELGDLNSIESGERRREISKENVRKLIKKKYNSSRSDIELK